MNKLEVALSFLARAMTYAATMALLLMSTLVVTSTFMRYFIGRPFRFTEEFVALLYMAMVFMAIPLATMRRSHVTVSVMPESAALKLGALLRWGSAFVMIAFCSWFAFEAFEFAKYTRTLNSRTEQTDLLLWPWLALIPAMMGLGAIIEAFNVFRRDKNQSSAADQPIGDGI